MAKHAAGARIECRSVFGLDLDGAEDDGLGADRVREQEFDDDHDQDQDQEQRKTSTGTRRAEVPIARSLPLAPRRRGLLLLLWDAVGRGAGAEGIRDSTSDSGGLGHGSLDGRRCRMRGEVLRGGEVGIAAPPVAPLVANAELGSRDRGPVDARRPELTRRASEELGKWGWRIRGWEAFSGVWTSHRESEERSASACFFPRPPRGVFVGDATCALVRCDLRPRRACASPARLDITPPPS
ncbi:hypothetical protein DFH09DRAFT_1165106 [Mycena vulgaris]|nr:hypothetical protein DFH09DRAFT_1165106 [Mycena vulgaris]